MSAINATVMPAPLEPIDDREPIARFLTSDSQYSSVGPKAAAFLPSKFPVETSVFRATDDPLEEFWSLADQHIVSPRRTHGAAILPASQVRLFGMFLIPDEPPPQHAVIRGWAVDGQDPAMEKAKRKEQALLLASRARLAVRST